MKYLLIFLDLVCTSQLNAQGPNANKVSDLVREVMIMDNTDGEMTISFWIPPSFWPVMSEVSPDIPIEIANDIKDMTKPYIIIISAHTDLSPDALFDFTSEQDLRHNIKVVDSEGKKYTPMNDEEVDFEVRNIINVMKPVFLQLAGEMGKGMHFYIFENVNTEGNPIIDESKEDSFTVIHSGRSFRYATPLVTLLPPINCPIDNVAMKGNWKYCPFHGVELTK